jgi:hypothetical protein
MISSSLPPYLASKPGQIFSEGIQIKHPNQWMVAHGFVITELNYGACSGSCGPHFLQKLNHHFFLQNLYVRMSSFF